MALYRDYDQAGLDAQYNNRAAVPDHPAILGRWAEASAKARDNLSCRLDLPYGPHERECVDIFPAPVPAAPVLAFVHGGYWQMLGRADFHYPAAAFVEAGVAFAAIGYPLAPEVGLDDIADSIRRAIQWLARNAGDFGADPGRLHLAGHSAGGHLTARMMAVADAAVHLRGGAAISGLYELEPIRLTYLNAALAMDAEAARRNSPIHQLPERAPPLILAVGGAETAEFQRQQADFAARWEDPRRPVHEIVMPGANHFTIMDRLAEPASPLFRAVHGQIMG